MNIPNMKNQISIHILDFFLKLNSLIKNQWMQL